jgi:PPOX class probable F420-dependent enzyme
MSKPPLPEATSQVLAKANPAVIATLRRDGQPVTAATWYLWEDGRILVNMDEGRTRLGHMRNDPRVTLTVLAADDWYSTVTLIGHVSDWRDDNDLTDIDRISTHYAGRPYPVRDRGRVSAWITVDRWYGWGSLKEDTQAG